MNKNLLLDWNREVLDTTERTLWSTTSSLLNLIFGVEEGKVSKEIFPELSKKVAVIVLIIKKFNIVLKKLNKFLL